jgi:MFS transporter, DHA1 family, multidrug resistance protein
MGGCADETSADPGSVRRRRTPLRLFRRATILIFMNFSPIRLSLPTEQWRRNRLAINIAAAMVFAGFTFVMPFLPLYVRDLGVKGEASIASWAGLLMTVAPLLASLLAPAWGRLADRHGMKIMVERCSLAIAIHWALFGFARNPYDLLWLRIMLGLFGGFQTLAMPMVVAAAPREHVSRSIGGLQTVQMISSAVGPLLGGTLADWIGIRNTCLVSSCCGLGALGMIHFLYREENGRDGKPASKSAERRISLREAVALPSFGTMIAILFTVNCIERGFGPVIPLYVLALGTSAAHAAKTSGLIISLGLLAEAVSASIMGNRLKTTTPRKLLLWRLGGGMLAVIPMGLVWSSSQLMALRLFLGLIAGGCMVVVYTLGSRIIPPETRGTSFSFLSSSALLGGACGPIIAGFLTHIDLRAVFFFNAFLFLGLFLLSWRNIRPPEKPAAGL